MQSAFALCAEPILRRATCRGVEKGLRASAAVHKCSLLTQANWLLAAN
jgi:hypothetical protein